MLNLRTKEHISHRVKINLNILEDVASNINDHCQIRSKETKPGKIRKIAQVSKKLKLIQRRILDKLLAPLIISSNAHGAVPKRSAKTNAAVHSGQRYIISIDLKSCFPNIHSSRVRKLFQNQLGCSPDVSNILTRLTTFDYHLTQGFSTSAALLNLICIALDEKIEKFIHMKNIRYSRYIDDITISGDFISEKTKDRIRSIIKNEGFIINNKKTDFSKGEKAINITGLNIRGAYPKVPRTYKRNIRAIKHNNMLENNGYMTNSDKCSLEGKHAYIKYIES